MQMSSTRPGLSGYVSDNRFRLTLLACALVLAATLAAVYGTAGFTPVWAGPDAAGMT